MVASGVPLFKRILGGTAQGQDSRHATPKTLGVLTPLGGNYAWREFPVAGLERHKADPVVTEIHGNLNGLMVQARAGMVLAVL